MSEYWNHNVAYHPLVLGAVPPDCRDALDVGCGDGMLAQKLATLSRHVAGIDPSAQMVEQAQERAAGIAELEFHEGSFLDWPFPSGEFDFVSFVASVHHMDTNAALTKATELLRPGGTLVVVGLARNSTPADWFISALSMPLNRLYDLRSDVGDPGHPMAEPKLSWGQVRKQARELLPGARYRHHLHYRYSLIWTKPGLVNAP